MTIGDLQQLLLAIFAISAGISIKHPDPRGYISWVALISGLALGIVILLILFKVA